MPKNIHTNKLLLVHFRNGNHKAFKTLFDNYWEPMFLKANSILRDREVAQDVVQEIWINLWNKREQLEFSNFEAYIFRSVSYGCFKYLRDNKFSTSHLQIIDSLQATIPDVENQHNLEATQEAIYKSLNKLPPRCRQIFKLSRMNDTTHEDIALKLGISKRSVENQISLALKVIRRHLASLHIISILYFLFLR